MNIQPVRTACFFLLLLIAVDATANDSIPNRRNFLQKILDYFNDANKEKQTKRFDFSIIGGPHYSSDTKLGVGLAAAGLYRADRNDTLLPPSNVSLYGDVTTVGFYLLGVSGNHIFPRDRRRLDYNLYFFSFPGLYWGRGFDSADDDTNLSVYSRFQARIKVDYLMRVSGHLYVGPHVVFDYINGRRFGRPELLGGADPRTTTQAVGFSLLYDSRDYLTNARRGAYLRLEQSFMPAFLGNKYAFSRTELTASCYRPLWKGSVLAAQVHTQLNYGDPPWGLLATLGGSYSMRGYYEGRYRDKCAMDAQVELRQHVWKRNGVVFFVGAGNIFSSPGTLRLRQTLPNYGFGYRWEFKKRVNVRLDMGFGKRGQHGFIFNINEAF